MPDQERVKGADGREYIVLPSGRKFPAEELEGNPPSTLGKIGRAVLNPETIGTAASFLAPETGGASMLIPAAAGAAWSVGEDLMGGNRDPASIAGHALTHGAVNAIPGVVRGAMSSAAEGGLPLVSAASRMIGGWKGKLLQTLSGGVGAGGGTAAGQAAATLSPELLSATLPNGLKIASADGLRTLLQKSVELENSGAPRATVDALDTLIGQVRQHLATVASQPMNVLSRAGLPATTAGAASGGRYANMLRAILPIGSGVNEAAR